MPPSTLLTYGIPALFAIISIAYYWPKLPQKDKKANPSQQWADIDELTAALATVNQANITAYLYTAHDSNADEKTNQALNYLSKRGYIMINDQQTLVGNMILNSKKKQPEQRAQPVKLKLVVDNERIHQTDQQPMG